MPPPGDVPHQSVIAADGSPADGVPTLRLLVLIGPCWR